MYCVKVLLKGNMKLRTADLWLRSRTGLYTLRVFGAYWDPN